MRNRYPAVCFSCQRRIDVGEGVIVKGASLKAYCQAHVPPRKFLAADGTLAHPYDADALILIRSCPGAVYRRSTNTWTVSVKDSDLGRTIEVAQKLGCRISAVLAKRAAEGTPLTRIAQKRSETAGLYPFQRIGVRWLASKERALLGDDMGLGKSVQSLVALPYDERVLIIAPASVKYNWQNEAVKWRPEYKCTVLEGRGSFRVPDLGEILVVNYDILPDWLIPPEEPGQIVELPAFAALLPSVILIADEAHYCKSHKAKRSQKVKTLAERCKKAWFLTGTPLLNKPFDLWGILQVAGLEREVFGKWDKFIELFGGKQDHWGKYTFESTPSPEVAERLRRVSIRRKKLDVLPELPGKTYQEIMVDEPTGSLKKKLDALLRLLEERGEIKRGKAGKIEGELPSFQEFSEIRAMLAKDRIPAMLELVEAAEEQGEPLIVFSAHREPIEALMERPGWGVIVGGTPAKERAEIVRAFQQGELEHGIAGTIGAMGTGVTLHRASVEVFVDRDWTPSLNLQAEDRAVRIGQKAKGVLIQVLYTNHPLDIHVHKLLMKKQRMITAALDSVAVLETENELRP